MRSIVTLCAYASFFFLLAAFASPHAGEPAGGDDSIYIKVEETRVRVRDEVEANLGNAYVTVYLNYPVDGPAQVIRNIDHTPGEIVDVPGSPGEKVLRITFDPQKNNSKTRVFNEYEATLWAYRVDFDKIGEIHPYDTESELYKSYTRSEPPCRDTENETVRGLARDIAAEAKDHLDFARRAFKYVAGNFARPTSSFNFDYPLTKTLNDKVGSDQARANLFVAILRSGGIPARVAAGRNAGNALVFWGEFYLEKYGWIPAKFNDSYQWIDAESLFGVGVAPPNLYEQRPHTVYLGCTQGVPLAGWIEQATNPYSSYIGNASISVNIYGGHQNVVRKIERVEE